MAQRDLCVIAVLAIVLASMPGAAHAQAASFWAAISSNPQLTSLAGLAGAGQTKAALQNPALAPYTLFAPTNAAFQQMLNIKIPGIDVSSFMNNKAILQMVMNLHLAPGKWTTDKMTNGQVIPSRLAGASGMLTVKKSGSTINIQSSGSSPKIVQPNILAGKNGVMQVIDGMLLPVKLSSVASTYGKH